MDVLRESRLREGFRLQGHRVVRPLLGTVSGPGGSARLEPKQMDLLVCLAERAGQLVPKYELLQRVWPGTFVSEVGLKRNVCLLRRALGDDPARPRWIQTVPRRGYRLLGACVSLNGDTPDTVAPRSGIAVLAFDHPGGDEASIAFGEGLAEEIRTRLGHLADLRVVSRTSSAACRDRDAREIARLLDVTTLVEGCVRQSGSRARVTVDVVEGADGCRRWSSSFEGDASDTFDLQDRIADAVVQAVEQRLRRSSVRLDRARLVGL